MATPNRNRPRLRTREALSFIARAGEELASSLDYAATLQSVAELAVPRVACYCLVDIREGDALRRAAMAHVDPRKTELLRATVEDAPDDRPGYHPDEVLQQGQTVLIERVADADLPAVARDRLARLDTYSLMAVPLIARGRITGIMELGSTRTDRFYGPGDVAVAVELARVAALSIDNARLFQAERDAVRLRDDVLSIVAHDLRNPLNTIRMAAELMQEEGARDGDDAGPGAVGRGGRDRSGMILRSADAMNRLIQDLLDVARVESGQALPLSFGEHDLADVVEEAAAIYRPQAERKGLRFETRADALPPVRMDRTRILQVLNNLIGNALKFTDSGYIRITAGSHPEGGATVTVADTGPGIPEAERSKIFDRFWQAGETRHGGAGLGLTIARGVVESHGGTIDVESEPGGGTTFRFVLPPTEAAPRSAGAAAGSAGGAAGSSDEVAPPGGQG